MVPHTRKPGRNRGPATALFAAISLLVGLADEAAGQWKPMELATGYLDPISVFDSTVFGVGPAGLWRYLEKDRSWSCVRPRFRPNTVIQAGTRFFALSDAPASERGVFRSSDGGATWESLLRGLGKADSLELLTARSAVFLGRYLVVGTGNAVYRSGDSGTTWAKVSGDGNGNPPLKGASWLFRQGASLIAADTQAVYRSADSGASGGWTFQGPGPGAEGFLEMVSIGKYLVARVLSGGGGVALYRSADGGAVWNSVIANPMMRLKTGDPHLYALNRDETFLMRSDDSGKSWARTHEKMSFDHFGVSGKTVYVVTWDQAAMRSFDAGASFSPLAPAPNLSIQDLASNGTVLLAGTRNEGVFRSPEEATPTSDGGPRWSAFGFTNAGIPSISMHGGEVLVRDVFGLAYSGNGGVTWMNVGSYKGIVPEPYVRSVFLADKIFFMVAERCIYRSADTARTWECVHPGYGEDMFINPMVFQRSGTDLFLGDSAGVHRSSDKGKTWTRASTGLSGGVRALASGGAVLFASGEGGVYRSSDRGESWVRKSADPGYHVLLAEGMHLFAAKAGVAYRSLDEGATWTRIDEGMQAAGRPISDSITALASTASALYAGTLDAGVWRRPFGEILPVSVPRGPGASPLPIGSDLRIRRGAGGLTVFFSLPAAATIRLELFDLRGNRCASAPEAVLAPGEREVGLPVPPGLSALHWLRFQAGGRPQIRNLVLAD